ncbi:MAG: hypothetical protein ABIN96_17725 [Rubrivivax sp.]
MSNTILKAVVLMSLACGVSAQTGDASQAAMPTIDPAMCDALANMPNSPMTVETCKLQLHLAKDDPSAHRKGDAAMSCADIFAELKTATATMGISDQEAARRRKSIRDTETLNQRHGSKAAAAMAPNMAALQTLGVISAVVPSAVTAPLIATQVADLHAKQKVAGDAYLVEARRLTGENASAVASTMSNPRTVRLSHLAMQKDCPLPAN